jgi:hypothetical protein
LPTLSRTSLGDAWAEMHSLTSIPTWTARRAADNPVGCPRSAKTASRSATLSAWALAPETCSCSSVGSVRWRSFKVIIDTGGTRLTYKYSSAHNPEDEEFGEERLQLLLRQTAHLPADEISARLSDEMKDWIRDAEQYDDLTVIVMKVR